MFFGNCHSSREASHKDTQNFILKVKEEKGALENLRVLETRETTENPRIRWQNETTDISKELKEQKRAQFLEVKRRQQLRQNNEELRLLERQLRGAQVTQERHKQRVEIEQKKKDELRAAREDGKQFETERLFTVQALKDQSQAEIEKKEKFRADLQNQMVDLRHRHMDEFEQLMRDRENMQKMLDHMAAEQTTELMVLQKRKEAAKQEIDHFMRARELHKLQQRADSAEEHEKFLEYQRNREKQQLRLIEEKRQKMQNKLELSEQIGKVITNIEREKRNREDLLLDLLVEERKAKEDLRYRQNLERQIQERFHMKAELERHREDAHRCKKLGNKLADQVDEQLRVEEKRIMAERNKLDQLANERLRRKVQEHKLAIQEMIAERQQKRMAATAEKVHDYEQNLSDERKRLQKIQEERMRLLCSQPLEVLRCLPIGVLQDAERNLLNRS